jgi:hypothetical protein
MVAIICLGGKHINDAARRTAVRPMNQEGPSNPCSVLARLRAPGVLHLAPPPDLSSVEPAVHRRRGFSSDPRPARAASRKQR